MMATLLTTSCSMPVYLAAVRMQIVATATPAVPFSTRKARGRSGELGLCVCPGELSRLLLACFRRQGLDRHSLKRLHNEWRVDYHIRCTMPVDYCNRLSALLCLAIYNNRLSAVLYSKAILQPTVLCALLCVPIVRSTIRSTDYPHCSEC